MPWKPLKFIYFMCNYEIFSNIFPPLVFSFSAISMLPALPPFFLWTFPCVHYRHGVWEGDPDPSHHCGGIRLLWPDDGGNWDRLLALLSCSDLQQYSQCDAGWPTQQGQERPWSPHTLGPLEDLLPWGSGALLHISGMCSLSDWRTFSVYVRLARDFWNMGRSISKRVAFL